MIVTWCCGGAAATTTCSSPDDECGPAQVIARAWLWVGALVVVAIGVVAFVTLGHARPGSPAQRLESWVKSSSLGQDVGTLEGDGRDLGKVLAAHRGIGAVHTVCAAMADDAQTYNGDLPSPDSMVTQLLARAYGLEYDAAESCYRARSARAPLLGVSSRDRSRATALFDRALRRIALLTGRTVPTTTTTAPDLTGTSAF